MDFDGQTPLGALAGGTSPAGEQAAPPASGSTPCVECSSELFEVCDVMSEEGAVGLRDRCSGECDGGAAMEKPGMVTAEPSAFAEFSECFSGQVAFADEGVHLPGFGLGEDAAEGTAWFAQCKNKRVVSKVRHRQLW